MTSPFPNSPRVLYERSPIAEVICQLRFPTILKIESVLPAGFQDKVRSAFPIFEQSHQLMLPGLPPGVFPSPSALPFGRSPTEHRFVSDDRQWSLSLTQDFIALRTQDYTRWETFWAHLEVPLAALESEYQPAHYARLGLRYVDVIQRSALGLGEHSWGDLLQPYILGELADKALEPLVQEAGRQVRFGEPNETGGTLLQHGLAKSGDVEEHAYVIDFDLYSTGRISSTQVALELGKLNRRAGCAFRWCITDLLHNALGPRELH